MYRVYFWNYSKKTNSTSHPSVTGSVDHYDCSLMDLSGILTPTLQLNGRNPTAFNYAYIEDFHRYYYVSNWRYNLGLWTCELQVDVLASWEEDIKSSALYVLRSASKWDNSIRDTVYPMLSGTLYSDSSLPNPFNTSYGSGYFVIGIVNTDTNTVGAISYYSFTSSQFRSFMYSLMSDIDSYGMFDISSDLTKLLANPFQYIVSCRWMPLEPPGGTAVSGVPIGWWSMNVAASRLGASSIIEGDLTGLSIPRHPQRDRGTWLDQEPYSSYYLVFAPFGAFSLPPENMLLADTLNFHWSVDYITGAAVLEVKSGGALVTRVEGQVGADIALAQMAPRINDMASAIFTEPAAQPENGSGQAGWLSVALSEWAGQYGAGYRQTANQIINAHTDIVAESQSILTGIANAWLSTKLPAQISGQNGGVSAGRFNVALHAWFKLIADETLYEKGRPLCQYTQLYGMTGFIQCGESDVSIPCTKPELEAIKLHLVSGMYLE